MAFVLLLLWASETSVIRVNPDQDLQLILDTAAPGSRILLNGTFHGQFALNQSLVLVGEDAQLNGGGSGTVLRVDAPDCRIEGLLVVNSGRDLRGPDCGIYVTAKGTGTIIRGNTLSNCAFGIWVHETETVEISTNRINGIDSGHVSNRGNGIHLFNGKFLTVSGNKVTAGRDGIYVSATENSLIEKNETYDLRFGIHYMYSYDNSVLNNSSNNNKVGYALMESRNIIVTGNTARNNTRNGLLFRDAQYCQITGNLLESNGEGMFFFSSTDNQIVDNTIRNNKTGVRIWAGSYRNQVSRNRFINNEKQIFFVGSADLAWGEEGDGNYWSDYLGWDQDGDGIGDRPYRVNSYASHTVVRYPASVLLLRSPGLELLSHLERILPVFRVPTVIDQSPLAEDPSQ